MDFGRYLLHTGRLSKDEFLAIHGEQLRPSLECSVRLDEIRDLASVREIPFGDILSNSDVGKAALRRIGMTVDELVDEWQGWHVENIEPLCIYSMTTRFGKRLYQEEYEKKRVAEFLVTAKVREGASIIGDSDTVAIPEGTSGTYVGLAIAANLPNVKVITSNAGLIREYRDNPAIARQFAHRFHIVGGIADFDNRFGRCEHGGVHGRAAESQFEVAIGKEPGATVVIMTVSGLLPDKGPYVDGPTRETKRVMMETALAHGVREIVFVTDYTKHIHPAKAHQTSAFGIPVFNVEEWGRIVSQNRQRISVVTVPTPALRSALAFCGANVARRNLAQMIGPKPFTQDDFQYDRVAKKLLSVCGSYLVAGNSVSMFHEVFEPSDGKGLYVFTVKSTTESFDAKSFIASLGRFLNSAISDVDLRVRVCDDDPSHVAAAIIGEDDAFRQIQSLCEFESQNVAEFRRRTGTSRIQLAVDGEVKEFLLQSLPAPPKANALNT